MKKVSGLAIGSSMLILSMLPAASAFAATAPSITLTEQGYNNIAAKVQPGGSVTFSASANGVTDPMYQFWVEEPNGSWKDVQNYSSTNTYTLSNVASGDYLVTAYVLSAANLKAGDYSAATNAEANGLQDVEGVFVDSTVTLSTPTAAATAGQTMTVTATAANIYNPLYQFWYKTPDGQWIQSGDYQSSSTFTFTPTETGTYTFIAYAKSPLALNNPEGASYSPTETAQSAVGQPTISGLTVTGETTGAGTTASPYLMTNNGSMAVSTTLLDANGNPAPGAAITYVIAQDNAPPTDPVTVMSDGVALSSTAASTGADYTVYTNAAGQAGITITGPVGQTAGYTLYAQAPYQVNNQPVETPVINAEFVTAGQAGITPYNPASGSAAFQASLGTSGVVPVTVTLPPVNTTAQVNLPVTFDVTTGGYFTNASGTTNLGSVATVYTTSAGQATVYVDAATPSTVKVTASATTADPSVSGLDTYVEWSQPGIASTISNFTITPSSTATSPVAAATDVEMSGVVEDVQGNPLPNAQLLLAATTGAYVVSGTSTDFPDVNASGLGPATGSAGAPATTTYGDPIQTNAAGQFTAEVTDTSTGNVNYYLYPVQNGFVSAGFITSATAVFGTSSVATAVNAFPTEADAATDTSGVTSLTGIQDGYDTASAPLYFGTVTSTSLATGTVTYNLSVGNSGVVYALGVGSSAPVPLNSQVSDLTVTLNDNNGTYTLSVPGGFSGTAPSAATPILSVEVLNDSAIGNTVLTVGSGNLTPASATVNVLSDSAAQAANFAPVVDLTNGQAQTVSYTVEDVNGNPVGDAPSTINEGSMPEGLWITQVNGIALSTTQSGVAYATPIPLSSASVLYNVSVPGVVLWGGASSSSTTVYSNSSGVVTLTLQRGPLDVWNGNTSAPAYTEKPSTGAVPSGSSTAYTYNGTGYSESNYGQLYFTGTGTQYAPANGAAISSINW